MSKIVNTLEKIRISMQWDTDILIKYFYPPVLFILTCNSLYTNDYFLALLTGIAFVINLIAIFAVEGRKRGII